jgi:hypothetical protein
VSSVTGGVAVGVTSKSEPLVAGEALAEAAGAAVAALAMRGGSAVDATGGGGLGSGGIVTSTGASVEVVDPQAAISAATEAAIAARARSPSLASTARSYATCEHAACREGERSLGMDRAAGSV